jgi:large subunit ribosomal protein L4
VSTSLDVRGPDGTTTGTVELPAEIFDAQANIALMHQVVVAQQAAARQGTHSTKTRGQVSGGGAKPYRQKGTGRARQGSTRAPQFTGGGVVFGPTTRDYSQRTPKKMKAAALRGALSDRARGERVHVVSHFVEGDVPSTKDGRTALAALTEARHVLVVAERDDTQTWLSLRNLPNVHLIAPDQLNTYDVLLSDDVVFTQAAYEAFVHGRTGREVVATAVARESEVSDADDEAPAKPAKKAAKKAVAAEEDAAEEDPAAEDGDDESDEEEAE